MNDLSVNEYELNRAQMAQLPAMENELLKQKLGNIGAWFGSNIDYKYFMLLNNDRRDYTVFNVESHNYYNASEELRLCLDYRGDVIDISYNHDFEYYEVWIRSKYSGEVNMYIIFPCNDFVIDC